MITSEASFAICTRTIAFSTSSSAHGVAMIGTSCPTHFAPAVKPGMLTPFLRHILTGSYHNYFRIYDTDTLNDVVLQADKSAFKAKKIGGPMPGNKIAAKNGRPGGLKETMAMDTLDFNKKILHASWHPKENTIAVRNQYRHTVSWHSNSSCRLLLRTICSCTVPHNDIHPLLVSSHTRFYHTIAPLTMFGIASYRQTGHTI